MFGWGSSANSSPPPPVIDRHKLSLDENQKKALEEMKRRFPDIADDEPRLKRFLRARDFDLKLTTEMLQADIKWRQEGHTNHTLESLQGEVRQGRGYFHYHDRENRPFVIVLAGKRTRAVRGAGGVLITCGADFPASDPEPSFHFAVFMVEEIIRRMPPGVETFTILVDFENWGWANWDLPLTRMLIAALQNDYPERLGRVLLLNTPFIFRSVWAIVKPLLQEVTRQKIIFCSGDVKAELLQYIAPEHLPEKYGGTSNYVHVAGPTELGVPPPPPHQPQSQPPPATAATMPASPSAAAAAAAAPDASAASPTPAAAADDAPTTSAAASSSTAASSSASSSSATSTQP